jgi:tryptophan-rich sensory protein
MEPRGEKMRWVSLLCWMLLTLAAGTVSGLLTARDVNGWHRTLIHPFFTPPDWLFGPVWTLLYVMMAIAVWLAFSASAGAERACILTLFLLQLALNFAWPLIFFSRHETGPAFLAVLVLWFAIAACIRFFAKHSRLAARLMIPYLAWVTFAAALNAGVWQLNR